MASNDGEVLSERTLLLPPPNSNEDARIDPVEKEKSQLSPSSYKFWLLTASYTVILFLVAANATCLAPILGAVAESLHAYENAATWFNASYMVASSCTNPSIGRFSTIFHPTYLFLSCTAAFTLGSLLTGLATNSTIFIAGRVITGCGAGGIFTGATVLLVSSAPIRRRGLFVGLVNTVITTGSSLGGVISGAFVVSRFGWRPAFYFQAPITTLAAVCIYVISPAPAYTSNKVSFVRKLARVDYLGIITLSISLILLLTAAMAEHFSYWPIALGVVAMLCFILVEAKIAALPIIPVHLLLHPPTLFGCLSTMCSMTARWTVLFYAPIWSIAVLGYHPASAGASLIPTSFGFGLGGMVVGALFIKHGGSYYWQSLLAIVALLSTYLIFNQLSQPSTIWIYLALLIANGVATGSVLNFTLAHVLATTDEQAIVTALYATFRGLAPSAGAGLAGGTVQRVLESSLTRFIQLKRGQVELNEQDLNLIHRLKGSPNLVWQLSGWQKEAGIMAYEKAIKSVFTLAMVICIAALVLQASTRWKAKVQKKTSGSDVE